MSRQRTRRAREAIAEEAAALARQRARFCPIHSYCRLGELGCWVCAEEAVERERSEGADRWKAEGAALGDRITIQTGDGSPAQTFDARPRRRRR